MSQDDSNKSHDTETAELVAEMVEPSAEVDENPFRSGAAPKAASSSSIEHYHPPRMGLAHLLAWVTLAAILMKFTAYLEMGIHNESFKTGWLWAVHRIVWYAFSAVSSASLLGAIVIMRDKLRGATGRLQPGHWIIVVYAIQWSGYLVINLARMGLYGSLELSSQTSSLIAWTYAYGAISLVTAISFLVAAVRLRDGFRWLLLMLALSGNGFLDLEQMLGFAFNHFTLSMLLIHLRSILPATILLMLLIIICIDRIRRCRRDGLHWLGVLILTWVTMVDIAFQILLKFAQQT